MTAVFSDLRYAIRQLRKRPVAEAALTERCGQPASIRRLVFSKPQLSLLSSGRELRFLLFGIRQFTFAPRRRSSLLHAQAPSEVRARGGRRVSAENHRSSRSPRLPWSSRSLLTALLTVISAPGSNPPRGVKITEHSTIMGASVTVTSLFFWALRMSCCEVSGCGLWPEFQATKLICHIGV